MLSHFHLISTVKPAVSRESRSHSAPLEASQVEHLCNQVRALLEKMRTSPNQRLDILEFEKVLKQVMPDITTAQCRGIFDRLDKEKSGSLQYSELLRNDSHFPRIFQHVMNHSLRRKSKKKHHSKRNHHRSLEDSEIPELVRSPTDPSMPHLSQKGKKKKKHTHKEVTLAQVVIRAQIVC